MMMNITILILMMHLLTSLLGSRGRPAKARLTCSYWGRLERFRGWELNFYTNVVLIIVRMVMLRW